MIKLQNEMRAMVSMGNVPMIQPGAEHTVKCCGPVEWSEVSTLRTVSRLGRCGVCGVPVAMVKKHEAA